MGPSHCAAENKMKNKDRRQQPVAPRHKHATKLINLIKTSRRGFSRSDKYAKAWQTWLSGNGIGPYTVLDRRLVTVPRPGPPPLSPLSLSPSLQVQTTVLSQVVRQSGKRWETQVADRGRTRTSFLVLPGSLTSSQMKSVFLFSLNLTTGRVSVSLVETVSGGSPRCIRGEEQWDDDSYCPSFGSITSSSSGPLRLMRTITSENNKRIFWPTCRPDVALIALFQRRHLQPSRFH